MNRILTIITLLITTVVISSCDEINDERIPPAAVYLEFPNSGIWNTYGVAGAGNFRYFIKPERIPDNFPYTEISSTGFAGIVLLCDLSNQPRAYDLACPVELKNNVRVEIDKDKLQAVCPKCGSRFDVFENFGYPLSGPAVEKKYGLQRYNVFGPDNLGGYKITR